MSDTFKRGAKEGLGFGVIAGVIFAMMEIAGAVMMGNPPLMPVRAFASVLLGQGAMQTASVGTVVVVGTIVHLALSAVFGLIYGIVNARFSSKTETSWGRQAGLGLLFGAMIWLVNFQIIARILYPWFLMMPQFLQMVMHAMFFGLPLALMYAAAERRVQHIGRAHAHA
jgi:uncharacterized membrane protein YagU involved in acid resistance